VRTPQKFDAELAKKGKMLHDKLCEKCHSEGGSVASDDLGILAGQKMAYLEEQFKFFKEGKRPIDKKMKPKMEELDKAGLEAVVNYYGSFK
jgi:cytochrome subunit of sulfide dehydrogenase